jgi:hypothetical protein
VLVPEYFQPGYENERTAGVAVVSPVVVDTHNAMPLLVADDCSSLQSLHLGNQTSITLRPDPTALEVFSIFHL